MADFDRQIERARQQAEEAKKRVKEAEKRAKQLEAKRGMAEAREIQSAMKGERAADTRRKILKGVCLDRLVEQGVIQRDQVDATLDSMLERTDDRELFGLRHREDSEQNKEEPNNGDSDSGTTIGTGSTLLQTATDRLLSDTTGTQASSA